MMSVLGSRGLGSGILLGREDEDVVLLVGRRLRWWWKRLRRTEVLLVVVEVEGGRVGGREVILGFGMGNRCLSSEVEGCNVLDRRRERAIWYWGGCWST